jgi:superfamily II DNA or RNA helicase
MTFQRISPDKGYRTGRSLWIPKSGMNNQTLLRNSLTFPLEQQAPIHAYEETDNHIIVPREFIPFEQWGTQRFDIEDRSPTSFPKVRVRCTAKPRDAVQATAMTSLLESGSGVLALACGKGKTVVSLMAWAKLGVPALVIVHTKELMAQWVERILEFTDLKKKDIGIYQGKKEDWQKPICIAMLKTLAIRAQAEELPVGFDSHFGVAIYDEVHHLGAPFFNVTASVGQGLRWGLSATHERDDGLDALYKYHIGEVVYENLEHDIIPETYFMQTGIHVPPDVWPKLKDRTGEVNIPKLMTWLSKHEQRNASIINVLDELRSDDRTILALSSRVDQLDELDEVYGDVSGKIHGKVSDKKRAGVLNSYPLVFATTQIAKEGLDRKEIDTVALLLPQTKEGMFRQVMGRGQRALAGKKKTVIIVFEDEKIPICVHMCRKLRSILTKLQYPFFMEPV